MVLDCASALLMASDRHGPCRGSSVWNAEAFPCLEVLPELVIIAELVECLSRRLEVLGSIPSTT